MAIKSSFTKNEDRNTGFDGGNSESFAEGVRAWAEDGCGESGYDYYN